MSLAHNGVLFLDELPEFRRGTLEVLRQPLEDGVVTISRVHARATYPARPLLVAAMNPCPCGYAGTSSRASSHRCTCPPDRVRSYRARISGPLLDRIDIQVALEPVTTASLTGMAPAERSAAVRDRVERARAVQRWRRAKGRAVASCNAALGPAELRSVARLSKDAAALLADAVGRYELSARAHAKIMRLARTHADLAGIDRVGEEHVAQAIHLRLLDRAALRAGAIPAGAAIGTTATV